MSSIKNLLTFVEFCRNLSIFIDFCRFFWNFCEIIWISTNVDLLNLLIVFKINIFLLIWISTNQQINISILIFQHQQINISIFFNKSILILEPWTPTEISWRNFWYNKNFSWVKVLGSNSGGSRPETKILSVTDNPFWPDLCHGRFRLSLYTSD